MVGVKQRHPDEIRTWAELQIPVLISCWEELPHVCAEIESWDIGEAQTYAEEWAFYEMVRHQLETASHQKVLTDLQEEHMARLRALVELHSSKLQRLLG